MYHYINNMHCTFKKNMLNALTTIKYLFLSSKFPLEPYAWACLHCRVVMISLWFTWPHGLTKTPCTYFDWFIIWRKVQPMQPGNNLGSLHLDVCQYLCSCPWLPYRTMSYIFFTFISILCEYTLESCDSFQLWHLE